MARRVGRRRSGLSFVATVVVLIFLAIGYFYGENKGSTVNNSSATVVQSDDSMTVEFLDVGQGDSIFITLPDSKTLLIDAANPGDGDEISSYLSAKGVTKIDFLVATHPHADHIGGMAEVINNFEIGQIFAPKVAASDVPTSKTYENFLTAVQNKGLKITAAKGGSTLFEGDGYLAQCLAPNKESYDGLNNYSIVFKLTHGSNTFLFTGDAEAEVEEEIIDYSYNLDCDVLKVGHHGSSSSSSSEFLEAVSPKYAVISCGKDNSYGHPHTETLTSLNNLEGLEKIYRTDDDGTVTAVSDGNGGIAFAVGGETVAGED